MSRDEVIEEVANWVDTYVIAEMIVEHLEEQDEPITVAQAKAVWLDTLEHLGSLSLAL